MRRLAYETSDTGLLSPDLAAGIRRVKGAKRLGVRIGNCLTISSRLGQMTHMPIFAVRIFTRGISLGALASSLLVAQTWLHGDRPA